MISVQDALNSILNHVPKLSVVTLPLSQSLGHTLAVDVHSPIHMPPFDNSAMDGYAIHEWSDSKYSVVGEIQAGVDASKTALSQGEAVRIFTGAMVPSSATTVVKQEITKREGDSVVILEAFKSGGNIRREGEQIKKGSLALPAGATLDAASIGYLAMLGIDEVSVYRNPIVKVLITGDELVAAGTSLKPGQIYESNAVTLISALNELGCDASSVRVQDDYQATFETVGRLLQECDLLLTSGGISVGDYDFVGKAMQENGVDSHFYKVKQKPGKPLYYGSTNSCQVFALPGNPASALTCAYIYVLPAIRKMMGAKNLHLEERKLLLQNDYSKNAGLTHFLKGASEGNEVRSLEHQSSSMLDSFAAANCLIIIPEDATQLNAGDFVSVYMLP
ncbi:MAG: hypothetical protein Crog4KO_26860 [Crocinitomicaceae bacterium]